MHKLKVSARAQANAQADASGAPKSFWDIVLGIAQTCVDRKLVWKV